MSLFLTQRHRAHRGRFLFSLVLCVLCVSVLKKGVVPLLSQYRLPPYFI
jgi:hypothetical protein